MVPGVYSDWDEANDKVRGYPGAKYKSFPSERAAELAFADGWEMHFGAPKPPKDTSDLYMGQTDPRDLFGEDELDPF